jgi:predicted MPP superfamily phosphohydrolase
MSLIFLLSKRVLASVITNSLFLLPFSFTNLIMVTAEASDILFGVISDVHLSDSTDVKHEEINLKNSLLKFKANNIKVLMVAGDIGNSGQIRAYQKFNKIYDQVFTDPNTRPKKVLVMGNHDYWNGMTTENAQNNFTQTLGVSLNSNVVVDGYHFIGVSTEAGDTNGVFTSVSKTWLKQQLDAAVAENPNIPIFVTFHQHISNTVYLSDAWGNPALDEVLKNYPQVITFSGHSHAVLDDERSIYQKDYTSVGTSTLSYTELEAGKANGSVPPRANEVAEGIIGKISNSAVTLERYDFHNDCKIKNDWIIDVPVNKTNFKYTDARMDASVAPYFIDGSKVIASNITKASCKISFDQAKDNDFVQSYKIQVYDVNAKAVVKDFLIFSDFYLGLQRMAPTLSYDVTGLSPDTNYEIRVYGIESFGKQGTPITTTFNTAENNSQILDILNVNFSDSTCKDGSNFNTFYELNNMRKLLWIVR